MTSADIPDVPNAAVSLAELWSIQESLLQAYRALFITVESVVFGLGAGVLALNRPIMIAPLVILGLVLMPIWVGVCRARARAVSFVHWMIQRHEAGSSVAQPYTRFREFQESRKFENLDVMADERFQKLMASQTRKRIDVQVPTLFVLMWMVLVIFAIFARSV